MEERVYVLLNSICLYFCRLLSIAEETLTEFLSKATGTAVEWVQMPGMKVHHRVDSLVFHHLVIILSFERL